MPRKSSKQTADAVRRADPNVMGLKSAVIKQPISETLTENYMPYAMSVIVSRAIPEIDGLKPSHRKLLYTMYKMGLLGGARTKSANIVGQTMKLNPHGDAAIYDTMVRLSQGYGALLHPFVDSKGNFGKVYSRDMAWAASRYTEARLAAVAAEFFQDIDQDAVDFVDNYDGSMKEPALLPTTFPNILVSANQGIAVGMASNLCGFNLSEICDTAIALMKDPEADLFDTLPAPDLPTGGELLFDLKALNEIYETGRGSFKVRARWRYIKEDNVIEVFEIPYSTTVEAILDKIAELAKSGKLKEISDVRDETDLNGLKIAIDLRRSADPEKVMEKLFKSTPLQDSQSCNFNVLIDGMPRVMGVRELLEQWTAWRTDCVCRRTLHAIQKKSEKLHLLEGLQAILLDIDKAIKIIRNTERDEDVVPNLMKAFQLDEEQAKYVADIRLRNINKEYILKRTQEVAALRKEIAQLNALVKSSKKLQKVIAKELEAVKEKYGAARRTEIVYSWTEPAAASAEEEIPDYPVTVFVSREGYLKKITPQSLRMSGEQKFKDGDALASQWDAANRDELLVFTDRQQCYKTRLFEFEDCKASLLGDYLPAKLGMGQDEAIVRVVPAGDYSGQLLFVFENGKAARIPMSNYQTVNRRKKLANAYSDKSLIVAILPVSENSAVSVTTSKGRCLTVKAGRAALNATRSSQGMIIVHLKKDETVVGAELPPPTKKEAPPDEGAKNGS